MSISTCLETCEFYVWIFHVISLRVYGVTGHRFQIIMLSDELRNSHYNLFQSALHRLNLWRWQLHQFLFVPSLKVSLYFLVSLHSVTYSHRSSILSLTLWVLLPDHFTVFSWIYSIPNSDGSTECSSRVFDKCWDFLVFETEPCFGYRA